MMSEDARVEAILPILKEIYADGNDYRQHIDKCAEESAAEIIAALAAADAVPGFTVVSTDDLRIALDVTAPVSAYQHDCVNRLKAKVGE
jgi:hypothetical protein